MPTDNTTPYLGLPLPHPDNELSYDVLKLVAALGALDTNAQSQDTAIGGKASSTAALTALAALTPAADRLPYFSASNAAAVAVLSEWIRTNLLPVTSASSARSALGLATVAASGAYADLSGRPTLAAVATSGAYADLSGKPSIPGTSDALTEGSTNLYFTAARVLASVLTGLSTSTNSAISATDTVLQALGKLQAQISGNASNGLSTITDLGERATSASETVNLDCATGDYFLVSMNTANTTGSLTLNLQNIPNTTGKMYTGYIEVVRGGRKPISFTVPGGMTWTWIQSATPSFQSTAGYYDRIMFTVVNNRTRINAMVIDTGQV